MFFMGVKLLEIFDHDYLVLAVKFSVTYYYLLKFLNGFYIFLP